MGRQLILILMVSAACGDPRFAPPADTGPAHRDDAAADAEVAARDAEVVAPDAGGAEGAGRRLLFRPLLGKSPVDNRLYDPRMDPTRLHWVVRNAGGTAAYTRLSHEAHADVPSDGPVLRVRADRDLPSAVTTEGLASGRPLSARLWVGHHIDEGDAPAEVSLSGTDARGLDVAVTLLPRDRPVVSRESNIEWLLYEGRWTDLPIGQFLLDIVDTRPGLELYVTGPEIIEVRALERRLEPLPSAWPRPMRPADYAGRAALRRALEERAPTAKPHPLPVVGEPLRPRGLR